jgi:hypothetical protein
MGALGSAFCTVVSFLFNSIGACLEFHSTGHVENVIVSSDGRKGSERPLIFVRGILQE